MRVERVEFFVGQERVRANWCTPDSDGPYRSIVQGPGWLGLKDAKDYLRYHQGFADAGYATLAIDYRGFGESEGARGIVSPTGQLEDLMSAVTYLTTRDDVVVEAIGAFATGGTGGGNVVLLAAADPRVRAVVSQVPVADGRDWLHRMRTEYEWIEFLAQLEEDRRVRVRTSVSRQVRPRDEIMVQTPERARTNFKKDVDDKIAGTVPLSMVDDLLRYRPVDAAQGLRTPLLVIAVENDATTPTDHAIRIFEAAAGPKRLVLLRNTSHYAAYEKYGSQIVAHTVAWFDQHLHGRAEVAVTDGSGPGVD